MKIISVRRKESRELLILKKLNHVNIIKLRNISYDAYEIFSYRFFLIKMIYFRSNKKCRCLN